jgi:hypothetical protein
MSSHVSLVSLVLAAVGLIGCGADASVDDQEEAPAELAVKQGGREFGICNADQIHNITVRMAEASQIADEARDHWDDLGYDGYVRASYTWFGTFAHDNVGDVIKGIAADLHNPASFLYWCNPPKPAPGVTDTNYNPACGEDGEFIAREVNFNTTPAVVLCPAFWGLSEQDKTTTLLHEFSHVEGADDLTYDDGIARGYARSDTESAASNAYNYEHYYKLLAYGQN